jgi:CRISPR-associated protein Csh1
LFQNFFTSGQYKIILHEIEQDFSEKREGVNVQIEELKNQLSVENDKAKKEQLKVEIKETEGLLLTCKELDDSDYLAFYLDVPLESYVAPHSIYLADKLFNTDKYNLKKEEADQQVLLGTSDFMNSFNSNMPFLTHQTATFDISGRISNIEAKALYQFEEVLKGKVLPNPLPIFIFSDEIQNRSVAIIKKEGYRVGYKEIIEKLFSDTEIKSQVGNYYLLNWANTKDGIVFNDFDYVSKFEYDFPVSIQNHFGKGNTQEFYNIFDFQNGVLPTIFNNSLIVKTKGGGVLQKYFDDIEEKYCKSALNYTLILKYRRAFYEFIYKSRRSAVTQGMFHDIMKTSILEDIRLDEVKNGNHQERFNIQNKLNIWFSLYEKFNTSINQTNQTMASKLTDYRQMMTDLVNGNKELSEISDEGFMFAAGQVIEYLRSKSKSGDTSYKLLEPYLQKTSAKELKRVIANDFVRYKHENFSRNFEKVSSMVLTYETEVNIKEYLPELLAGIFSDNQLFSNKSKETPTV